MRSIWKTTSIGNRLAASLMALTCYAPLALAQPGPPPAGPPAGAPRQMPPTRPIVLHPLGQDIYWTEGGVGNAGVIIGEHGVILIDTTISQASARELIAAIARITPKPITAVVLTHGDIDHVSGLNALPVGIAVYAQDATRARLAASLAAGHGMVAAGHLPNHGVATREALTIEGRQLVLLHWAPAHTDGDLVIDLPREKLVFTGDIFALDQPRALIHPEQHGSSAGWVETARGILALDADRFVVGHGPVQDRAGLQARLDLAAHEREEVIALARQGMPLAEIQRKVDDPPHDAPPANPNGPHFDAFSKVIYDEVKAVP